MAKDNIANAAGADDPDLAIALKTVLCVDLDGTLVRVDTLVEGVLALVGSWSLLRCILVLLRSGRAAFKAAVAAATEFNPALLPYNDEFVAFLRSERQLGRRIILVTAADRKIANLVSEHVGLFDDVMASDGKINLKGHRKAAALADRFGKRNFTYAGDSSADLEVWRVAGAAIVVGASAQVERSARRLLPIERTFPFNGAVIPELARALRPHQWVKNFLVFVPILTAGVVDDPAAWRGALLAFIAFSGTASGIYIINDLLDLAADRGHPRKRNRPFARGAASPVTGLVLSAMSVGLGFTAGWFAGVDVMLLAYGLLSICYSFRLKELPLVDVFTLAALYTIRIIGGGVATGHIASVWLLAFSSFLFLSLAFLKRVAEINETTGKTVARRGYLTTDGGILEIFGCCAAFSSCVVLALFVQSESATSQYVSSPFLWCLVPVFLFWQCRLWLSADRGWMDDDPIVFAFRDWVSWAVVACICGILLSARMMPLPLSLR